MRRQRALIAIIIVLLAVLWLTAADNDRGIPEEIPSPVDNDTGT